MSKETLKKLDQEYIMHTYGRYDVALKSGKGAAAEGFDGEQYLDMTSGIGVTSLGYCHDGFNAAVTAQLQTLQHTSNLFYTQPAAELAKTLCQSGGFSRAFFANSGAEANECAIKLARKYYFDKTGNAQKSQIATLKNSFHGRTITTLAATGQDVFHNYFFPFTEGFFYVEPEDFDALKAIDPATTAAIILECIQGEGGVNILSQEYVTAVAAFCKQHDILLIADEVQTGIGRTGKLFAFEHYGIVPDIVTLAKGLGGGLPIGACLCADALKDTFSPSTHGTTFGGNPVVCAGANYVLSVINTQAFLQEVTQKGEYLAQKLTAIAGVKSVRHMGLMFGIELANADAKDIAAKCAENGLLVLTAKTLLRLLPPLTISYEEIDRATEILKSTLCK
ncbi:MAG: acetylornithine/succinylornithine family transaminase [Oscillospiraceae bacterium]|jgi:acetylornithine/N-succinyldiaminopimelate aminotransferase|nr:acetylornithine/succinylornithine family transaminase [Oscillospiraceae bacterium]